MRCYNLLALVLVGALAGRAAAGPCFSINWFPIKSDIVGAINCRSDDAPGGCAEPAVWSLTNQDKPTEAPMSLTRGAEDLFKVALPAENGADQQRTFVMPTSPLAAGSNVDATACVNTLLKPVVTHRRALRAPMDPAWTTTSPLITGFTTIARLTGPSGVLQATSSSTSTAMPLQLLPNLPEGEYCWTVNVTANINTTAASNGTLTLADYATANTMTVDAAPKASYTACFYKRAEQATANLTYDMCRLGKLELNLTAVSPLAVPLTKGGAPVADKWLLRPLLKVYGKKVKELDGSESTQEYDGNAQNPNYIAKYFLLPTNATGADVFNYVLDQSLEEGYYQLSAVVSAMTDFPSLVALTGLTVINQSDYQDQADIYNKYEVLSKQLINATETGIQTSPTTIGAISASPTRTTIKAGDQLTFSWTFRGVGSAVCLHDGEVVDNCTSPVKVAAKALTADTKKTFTVVFTDICGRQKNASYSYTQSGVTADSKVELPITGTGGTGTGTGGTRNAAVGVATSLRTLVLSLLAAVAFAALL